MARKFGYGQHTYGLLTDWAKCPPGFSLRDVAGVAVDSSDNVYVLSRTEHPIAVFDREGHWVRSFGEGFFSRAHGASFSPDGTLWCTDDGRHTVSEFSVKGELLLELGERDKPSDTGFTHLAGKTLTECLSTISRAAPPFNRPTGVAVSPSSGAIFVADGYGNARVHKFSCGGSLLMSWGQPGTDPGQFRLPHAVWVDTQARVWVADRENRRIQVFTEDGEFLFQIADLLRPAAIAIDTQGLVYIAEVDGRVSIFGSDGAVLTQWGNESEEPSDSSLFVAPHAIAVDSHGDIYVGEVAYTSRQCDRGPRTIQKFVRRQRGDDR